jgi:hypothetical protein
MNKYLLLLVLIVLMVVSVSCTKKNCETKFVTNFLNERVNYVAEIPVSNVKDANGYYVSVTITNKDGYAYQEYEEVLYSYYSFDSTKLYVISDFQATINTHSVFVLVRAVQKETDYYNVYYNRESFTDTLKLK